LRARPHPHQLAEPPDRRAQRRRHLGGRGGGGLRRRTRSDRDQPQARRPPRVLRRDAQRAPAGPGPDRLLTGTGRPAMGAQAGGIASPPMRSDTSIEAAPTVLVVDDDAAVRRLLRRVLCGRGFDVIEAANGAAALAAVSEQPVDVVLLDSVLPDRVGLDVLDTLRSDPATATLPVILLTGRAPPAERVQGLEAGASDYLVKPVDLNELVARVRAQLRGRDLWRSQVADALHQRAALAGAIASISESCGLE